MEYNLSNEDESDPDVREAVYVISLTNFCQALHALPRPGGILDQDCRVMHLMGIVLNAQSEKQKMQMEEAKRRN